jgi:hypothetical protein
MSSRMSPRVDATVGAGLSGRSRFDDLFHLFEELGKIVLAIRNYAQNKSRTSMMMANGTQQATAQEIPTKLTRMMAYIKQSAPFNN